MLPPPCKGEGYNYRGLWRIAFQRRRDHSSQVVIFIDLLANTALRLPMPSISTSQRELRCAGIAARVRGDGWWALSPHTSTVIPWGGQRMICRFRQYFLTFTTTHFTARRAHWTYLASMNLIWNNMVSATPIRLWGEGIAVDIIDYTEVRIASFWRLWRGLKLSVEVLRKIYRWDDSHFTLISVFSRR